MLKIENLHVNVGKKEILKGVNLEVKKNEKVFILGPNGSGKSTLALSIMSYPKYKITDGKIYFENEDITDLPPNEKVKRGIFICMQTPIEIEGVSLRSVLQIALKNLKGEINLFEFDKQLEKNIEKLKFTKEFMFRDLNVGFSGGEKKKSEILQLITLNPKLAILDEFDTGLDVDSLKFICNIINNLKDTTFLIITHYTRILKYIKPDSVIVMNDGKIVAEGNADLAYQIEERGYESILRSK